MAGISGGADGESANSPHWTPPGRLLSSAIRPNLAIRWQGEAARGASHHPPESPCGKQDKNRQKAEKRSIFCKQPFAHPNSDGTRFSWDSCEKSWPVVSLAPRGLLAIASLVHQVDNGEYILFHHVYRSAEPICFAVHFLSFVFHGEILLALTTTSSVYR
ncbi:hypothetical protein J6590_093798 [Homalodisca vitripennis]|nr:hypothetical protein J6590_091039 [Homalodisca vitripennis]KAG8329114.1 hypothetical protein J6590_094495 [Homalodisca vitripennis]KAG8329138.1 hypothetical protein J6590_093798 [Homalodisca vitripennis]